MFRVTVYMFDRERNEKELQYICMLHYMKAHIIQYQITRYEYDCVGNLTNIDYLHLLVKVCVRRHINGGLYKCTTRHALLPFSSI